MGPRRRTRATPALGSQPHVPPQHTGTPESARRATSTLWGLTRVTPKPVPGEPLVARSTAHPTNARHRTNPQSLEGTPAPQELSCPPRRARGADTGARRPLRALGMGVGPEHPAAGSGGAGRHPPPPSLRQRLGGPGGCIFLLGVRTAADVFNEPGCLRGGRLERALFTLGRTFSTYALFSSKRKAECVTINKKTMGLDLLSCSFFFPLFFFLKEASIKPLCLDPRVHRRFIFITV